MRGIALIAEVLLLHKIPHLYKKEKPIFFPAPRPAAPCGALRGVACGFPQERGAVVENKIGGQCAVFGGRAARKFSEKRLCRCVFYTQR
jgi:hypothetical protein